MSAETYAREQQRNWFGVARRPRRVNFSVVSVPCGSEVFSGTFRLFGGVPRQRLTLCVLRVLAPNTEDVPRFVETSVAVR
jgi:hypothetical protein